MKFVMLGSGAVGSYFGAVLQQTGHEVVFVARGEQLRALRENGLTLRDDGSETRLTVTATDDVTTLDAVDYVLVSVKTWQLDGIAPMLSALKGERTCFLTLQNGVEAPGFVAEHVGAAQIFGGLARGFFLLEAPGVVRHAGVQPSITFGRMDRQRTPEAEALRDSLTNAGVYALLSDDIEAALWEKFLQVTALSGVGAVTRAPLGEIRGYPPTRRMLEQAMVEIVHVASARNIQLSDDVIERSLAFFDTFPHDSTTSMQRDILNGLPSELEAQTGAAVRLGHAVSVATPINGFIYDSLILQEMRARGTSPSPRDEAG